MFIQLVTIIMIEFEKIILSPIDIILAENLVASYKK